MRNVLKLSLLAVALVVCGTSLSAQKFAYIDRAELITAMPERDSAEKKLAIFHNDLISQLEILQVEINNKYQDFQKISSTSSDAIRQLKEKEIQDLLNRREEFQVTAQQDFQKTQDQLMSPVIARANEAIAKVSKSNGYAAVFDLASESMAYIDKDALTDLLPMVKKELGIK